MVQFTSVDTISIKNRDGLRTIHINGKKITAYGFNGISLLANQINSLSVNDLGYFNPIIIGFDEVCTQQNELNYLAENIILAVSVVNEDNVEVLVTFMDPVDIDGTSMHEKFQTTLEMVVQNNKYVELYEPVGTISKKTKKENKTDTTLLEYSEVGYVQFTVSMIAETFNEIFLRLNSLISKLDKETRKLMKQS